MDKIDQRNSDIESAIAQTQIVVDVFNGVNAMRNAGERYLPKLQSESAEAFAVKLKIASLFNAVKKTIEEMTGRAFIKPVAFGADTPDFIKEYAENINLEGQHLNNFMQVVFSEALKRGLTFIHVENEALSGDATQADVASTGARPYFIHIKLEDVIDWNYEKRNGALAITRFVIYEKQGDAQIIREITEREIILYKKTKKNEWIEFDVAVNVLGYVPVVPIYAIQEGFLKASTPLIDLAEVNVSHWQSSVDQSNILHYTRVPILFLSGSSAQETPLVIGATNAIYAPQGADMRYIEHGGKAIEAGLQDIQHKELQMQALGLQMYMSDAHKTATGEALADVRATSRLSLCVGNLKDGIEQAFVYFMNYLNQPPLVTLEMQGDFAITGMNAQELQFLLNAVNSGIISKATFWNELKARGVLSDLFEPVAEQELIDLEL